MKKFLYEGEMAKDMTPTLGDARPLPSKVNALHRIRSLGLPVSEVIDVGVRECTAELISVFPNRKHHLFEPAAQFHQEIRHNYRALDHALYPIALSDENSDQFLVVTCLMRDGIPTHSSISPIQRPVDGKEVIDCRPLAVRRFDSLGSGFAQDFLLKVDVDGFDLNVLRGFGSRLRDASIVIVETTFNTFVERCRHIVDSGFALLDLVDLIYYGDFLYQFDSVFIRNDLVDSSVRPPIINFQTELWRQFSPRN